MAVFSITQRVRFQHCDPAGIVFYPRYFEILNLLIERWFDEALGVPFGALHLERNQGVPTVRTEVDFHAASRMDETLYLTLGVIDLRGSAIVLRLEALGSQGDLRLRARHTLVWVTLNPLRATPIPGGVRRAMRAYLDTAEPRDGEERPPQREARP